MRTKIYLSVVTLILLTSCNAIDDLLTFTIDNQTTFKISSGFPIGTAFSVPQMYLPILVLLLKTTILRQTW
jgi:hypothetical protein